MYSNVKLKQILNSSSGHVKDSDGDRVRSGDRKGSQMVGYPKVAPSVVPV